ncbi:MAG: DUF1512 family protein [Candidatus Freyarchaeota archaeon]|nr:DUF1512 family protein [Candidatus Jordarchaeia archaeon]
MIDSTYQLISYIVGYAILFFICFLVGYRQELVFTLEFRKVKQTLKRLEKMEAELKELFEREFGCLGVLEEARRIYDHISDFFIILPEESDPIGSVDRLKHILSISRQQIEREVNLLTALGDEESKVTIRQVFLEASRLSRVYKLVRHLYLTGVKSKNLAGLVQALSQLPFLEITAKRSFSILKCYLQEPKQPIGCGIGPLVARALMESAEKIDARRGAVVAERVLYGKHVVIIKPKGPGARTEEDASEILMEEVRRLKNPSIVLVSAQPKLKGENGVAIVQGAGAATTYEPLKFELESMAARKKFPILSVLVKLSEEELSSRVNRHSQTLVAKALEVVENVVKTLNEPIIIAGLGNSFMIP